MHKYVKTDYAAVGRRVRDLRSALSQADFAEKYDITQTDISRIERGEIRPTIDLLCNISIDYNVNLNWLISGEEPMRGFLPSDRLVIQAFYDHDDAGTPLWKTNIGILEERQIEALLGIEEGGFEKWWQSKYPDQNLTAMRASKTAAFLKEWGTDRSKADSLNDDLKPEVSEILSYLTQESSEFLIELLSLLKARKSDIEKIKKMRKTSGA